MDFHDVFSIELVIMLEIITKDALCRSFLKHTFDACLEGTRYSMGNSEAGWRLPTAITKLMN